MAGTKEIKRRIKSVKNTKKITKAMELVAASKMKRAVASTMSSRLYAEYSSEILTSIANGEVILNPLFTEQESGKNLFIIITSNRGLCGAYNAQVIKKTISALKSMTGEVDVVTIGKKGDLAMRRLGQNIKGVFTDVPDASISLADIEPISRLVMNEFKMTKQVGEEVMRVYKNVYVAYTDFVSALVQKSNIKQILPVSKIKLKEFVDTVGPDTESTSAGVNEKTEYLFEGDKDKLIATLAEKIVKMQIYQMFLESNASEQSSRMVAMKNASEASGEMIDDLTLMFNKARQANITREISEISAGMASVS